MHNKITKENRTAIDKRIYLIKETHSSIKPPIYSIRKQWHEGKSIQSNGSQLS